VREFEAGRLRAGSKALRQWFCAIHALGRETGTGPDPIPARSAAMPSGALGALILNTVVWVPSEETFSTLLMSRTKRLPKPSIATPSGLKAPVGTMDWAPAKEMVCASMAAGLAIANPSKIVKMNEAGRQCRKAAAHNADGYRGVWASDCLHLSGSRITCLRCAQLRSRT